MTNENLITEARLSWLHQLVPYVSGRPISYKMGDNKLVAILDINLLEVQQYLSFMQREFGVNFEVCTKEGYVIPMDYNVELAVQTYLTHSPLGHNPMPALFKENVKCPLPFEKFRILLNKHLAQISVQFKEEVGAKQFSIFESGRYVYTTKGTTYHPQYCITIDGRQRTRYNKLAIKYGLPDMQRWNTLIDMDKAVSLIQYSNSLSPETKTEFAESYELLKKWGKLP